jgi:hypothetical protein
MCGSVYLYPFVFLWCWFGCACLPFLSRSLACKVTRAVLRYDDAAWLQIIGGVMDMSGKAAGACLTPMDSVFALAQVR